VLTTKIAIMASDLHALVGRLQQLEESLIDIVVDSAMKISKLTDVKFFILIESADEGVGAKQRILGDPGLKDKFRHGRLEPSAEQRLPMVSNDTSSTNGSAPVETWLLPDEDVIEQSTIKNRKRQSVEVVDVPKKIRSMTAADGTIVSMPEFKTDNFECEEILIEDDGDSGGHQVPGFGAASFVDQSFGNPDLSLNGDQDQFGLDVAAMTSLNLQSFNPSDDPIRSVIYQRGSFILNPHLESCDLVSFLADSRKAQAVATFDPSSFSMPHEKRNHEQVLLASFLWDIAKHVVSTAIGVPFDKVFFNLCANYMTDFLVKFIPSIANEQKYLRWKLNGNLRCLLKRQLAGIERNKADKTLMPNDQ